MATKMYDEMQTEQMQALTTSCMKSLIEKSQIPEEVVDLVELIDGLKVSTSEKLAIHASLKKFGERITSQAKMS